MYGLLCVVGKSGSGKTTIIERIIPELIKRGYKVGTIKHDAHEFEIDHKGKDTWRMAQAGAETVVIASSDKIAMVKKIDSECNIDQISEWLLKDVDIVIAEGYKKENKPKLEVTSTESLTCAEDSALLGVILNTEQMAEHGKEKKNMPVRLTYYTFEEIIKITDMIENAVLKKD
ncbi:MAG: molybdopterin-guanine dinucleotide biosynthesis protein B [Candidatus Firestonebacteria bacterium RIFOXYC2_FULL_39_67]|nr:MAG: molybdopterin-guanine dinucleotide biosynthesis protein B [Candidatus Firestonebacteria bacterium RIFOXYC2_FULL_39_67]